MEGQRVAPFLWQHLACGARALYLNTLLIISLSLLCNTAFSADQSTPAFQSATATIAALKPLANIQKGEFESSNEFGARMCTALAKALNATAGKPIAFRLLDDRIPRQHYYDADKQVFQFLFMVSRHSDVTRPLDGYAAIPIAASRKDQGAYVAQNAFGASITVTKSDDDEVVVLLPINELKIQNTVMSAIKLPAKREAAPTLDSDLGLVITTKVQSPCFVFSTSHLRPEIKLPRDITTRTYAIVGAQGAEWRIVRNSTNETLKVGKF